MERRRYARARVRGHAQAKAPSAVVGARYDSRRDCIELTFRAGVSMTIHRKMVPGLERATTASLNTIQVSPAGDALSWRSLDVDVFVPGLVERVLRMRHSLA